jgi:hypothetical protein
MTDYGLVKMYLIVFCGLLPIIITAVLLFGMIFIIATVFLILLYLELHVYMGYHFACFNDWLMKKRSEK